MNYEQITVDTSSHVCTVTLNRADKLNAWTQRMENEFRHAVEAAAEDANVRAIVVTGAGRGFCSGADMSILEAGAAGADVSGEASPDAGMGGTGIAANYTHRFSYLLRVPKPIIAAINGPVAGIGLCMTMFCDFRYMAQGQKLTTAFAKRGLIAEHGVSWLLPRLVGLPTALDLLCSARKFRAPEALAMGLVNRVIPDDKLLAETRAYATLLANTVSPRSVAVMKRQLWEAQFQTLAEATVTP